MEESLTGRVIAAHGDIVRKLHNVEEAQRARDAFTKVGMMLVVVNGVVKAWASWRARAISVKSSCLDCSAIILNLVWKNDKVDDMVLHQAMYDRLFSWIVSQVNAAIDPSTTEVIQSWSRNFIE